MRYFYSVVEYSSKWLSAIFPESPPLTALHPLYKAAGGFFVSDRGRWFAVSSAAPLTVRKQDFRGINFSPRQGCGKSDRALGYNSSRLVVKYR